MLEIKLPLDFERLPEFWQLTERLRDERAKALPPGQAYVASEITNTAILLWVRLWVALGYLARSTNRPGWLSDAGVRMVNASFTNQFSEELQAVDIMEGNLLKRLVTPAPTTAVSGTAAHPGYMCDLFALTNGHLAGDYLAPEKRGNLRSRLNAVKTTIAATAMQQAQLLPSEVFKKRDSSVMTAREVDRSMILILTVDRCLKARARLRGDYTPGLLADACAAMEATKPDELQNFYYWLLEHAGHPPVPESTEEILKDWGRVFQSVKG